MKVYKVLVEVLDYVFYATVERGTTHETGAFIHNYAIAYALGLGRGATYSYTCTIQKPAYKEELSALNGRLYVTPAAPQQVAYRLVQWNTLREGFAYPNKPPSLGYPDWGFARMLRPGSQFVSYLMLLDQSVVDEFPTLQRLTAGQPVWIRLGKFTAKARMSAQQADSISTKTSDFLCEAFLNWRDLDIGVEPEVCDVVVASRPTRLLSRAQFANAPFVEARFGEAVVRLPTQVRFCARYPEARQRSRR